MMIRILLLLVMLQASVVFAAPIKVDVDRKSVSLNESFQITFSTTEQPGSVPDFTELEKDFEIIDRNQGSTLTWVNEVSTSTIQWTFNVMPKHTGTLTIPAMYFGREISPAISIVVIEGNKPDIPANNSQLFLEVDATPKQTYVQSQILYRVRIFTQAEIAEAQLSEPEIADAVVTKLGEDKKYKTQQKGIDYVVVERNYAIFPQKSGSLTISPLTLTAAVLVDVPSGFGGIFSTRNTRTERIFSKAVTLTVLPAPQTFTGHWLAANQLQLKQQWSGDVQNMKVGEPLTRTLTLTAKGTTVSQIPKLSQASGSDDLKTYPDQPRLEEQKTPQGIVAIREEKIAFIPSKPGIYTLPALEIPWFNLNSRQMEVAKIPAMTVTATGVGNILVAVDKTVEKPVGKAVVINNTGVANKRSVVEKTYFWQGLAAFFVIGWIITLILFFKKQSGFEKQSTSLKPALNQIDEKNNLLSLKKACANSDASAAKQALIVWGKGKYNATTLGAIAECCDARLRTEILSLNHILYGQQPRTWDGRKLFQAFSEHRAMEKTKPKADDKLEPLHRL